MSGKRERERWRTKSKMSASAQARSLGPCYCTVLRAYSLARTKAAAFSERRGSESVKHGNKACRTCSHWLWVCFS